MDIDLFVKENGEWGEAIPGTGGSQFVSKEKSGLYTNDECFKMALTDAISVACKALGMGADVYWQSGRTKYDLPQEEKPQEKPQRQLTAREMLIAKLKEKGINATEFAQKHNLSKDTTEETYKDLLIDLGD
jgi:DNA-binding NarL/FixJ family response regulator